MTEPVQQKSVKKASIDNGFKLTTYHLSLTTYSCHLSLVTCNLFINLADNHGKNQTRPSIAII